MESPPASRQRAGAIDRLSDLPDGVLADVVSRLTFRQAVQTGVLSRRWRNLWHAVPYPRSSIDIDQRAFRGKGDYGGRVTRGRRGCGDDEVLGERFRFEDFGDRVTSSAAGEPPALGAFRLRVKESSFRTAHRWIRRALTRRPVAVAIRCGDPSRSCSPERPEFSFALHCRAGGAFTCRPRALQLFGVTLEGEFAYTIADELPVLEDLRLEECDYSFARIASTSLQNQAIYNCTARVYSVDVLDLA